MKKYSVYYNNNVECNKVAEFATLDEAKAYCIENTKGCDEVCAGDNCYEGRSNNFRYEVYEGDSCFIFLTRTATLRSSRIPFVKQNSFIAINKPISKERYEEDFISAGYHVGGSGACIV